MPSIKEVKSKLSRVYMRRHSIHNIGLRPASKTIVIRVDGPLRPAVIKQLESEAKPYKVLVIDSAVACTL